MTLDTTELRRLATKLEATDPHGAARLLATAEAIDHPDDHRGWAGISAEDAVSVETIVDRLHENPSRARAVSQAERVRNVLVLVPVLVTWLGLMFAAAAYRSVVAADPTLMNQPFLLLWEQGFPTYDGPFEVLRFLNLSTVALIDTIVIGAVLFLTWYVHGQTSVAAAAAAERTRKVEGRLRAALLDATLEFRVRGSISEAADRFGQTANRLLDELKAERTHLEDLVNGRERRMNDMRAFSNDIKAAAAELSTVSYQLATTVAASATASDRVLAAVMQLESRIAGLDSGLTAVGADLAASSATLRSVSTDTRTAQEGLADAVTVLGPSAARVTDSIEVLRVEISELRRLLGSIESRDAQAAGRSVEALDRLADSITGLHAQISANGRGVHGSS